MSLVLVGKIGRFWDSV